MVRLATLEDIDDIKKIADKNTKTIGFVIRGALIEHCNKKTLLVSIYDNKIVGFCNYHHRKDDVNTIYELCVDDKYRHKGLAKELLNSVPLPIRLKCPVDNESNNFYKKIGMKLEAVEPGKKRALNVYTLGEVSFGLF